MKRVNTFIFVFIFVAMPWISAQATDLTIGRILSPSNPVAARKAIPIQFWVLNINKLDAPSFTLTVTIKKKGNPTPVYSSTFQGSNLPKYDSVRLNTPTLFTPPDTGDYNISINVNYAEDINRSNDTKNASFTALAPPDIGTRIRQFSYFKATGDSLSTMGIIEFMKPPKKSPAFINVLIRRNDTSEVIWIVRNLLYLPPEFTPQNPIGMFIDFARLGINRGEYADSVQLCIYCTDVPLSEAPKPDITCEVYKVNPDIYAVGPNNIEQAAATHPEPFYVDSLPTFLQLAALTDTVERACTMPNIDLDSSKHQGTAAGYKGDWNSCGPTAVANSMEWLEKSNPSLMKTGLSHREKLEEISSFSNREANGATAYFDFIKSKLAFIDKYKLPIKVKFQGVWGHTSNVISPDPRYGHFAEYQGGPGEALAATRCPSWAWTVKEMKDSEDVEMFIGWWDSTGARKGGHYFTLTGTAVINGQKQFRFKDDNRQDTVGGTRMPSVFWNVSASGWGRILDLSWRNRTCFIEAVVSESFDTSVKYNVNGVNEKINERKFLLTLEQNPTLRSQWVAADVFIVTPGNYRLSITDISGKEVIRLADNFFDTGAKRFYWDGTSSGLLSPAGIYFMTMSGGGMVERVKIVRY